MCDFVTVLLVPVTHKYNDKINAIEVRRVKVVLRASPEGSGKSVLWVMPLEQGTWDVQGANRSNFVSLRLDGRSGLRVRSGSSNMFYGYNPEQGSDRAGSCALVFSNFIIVLRVPLSPFHRNAQTWMKYQHSIAPSANSIPHMPCNFPSNAICILTWITTQ
jgi:hypothetical protein